MLQFMGSQSQDLVTEKQQQRHKYSDYLCVAVMMGWFWVLMSRGKGTGGRLCNVCLFYTIRFSSTMNVITC